MPPRQPCAYHDAIEKKLDKLLVAICGDTDGSAGILEMVRSCTMRLDRFERQEREAAEFRKSAFVRALPTILGWCAVGAASLYALLRSGHTAP